MKYAFIGTYPPRECGIGTFTNNLLDSVLDSKKARKGDYEGFVVAVNDHDLTYDYPQEVKLTIRQEDQQECKRGQHTGATASYAVAGHGGNQRPTER